VFPTEHLCFWVYLYRFNMKLKNVLQEELDVFSGVK